MKISRNLLSVLALSLLVSACGFTSTNRAPTQAPNYQISAATKRALIAPPIIAVNDGDGGTNIWAAGGATN